MHTHYGSFGFDLLDPFVGNATGSGIVDMYQGWGLEVAHFNEGSVNGNPILRVENEISCFCFGGR
jgi:hypothetical protein